MKVLVQAWAYKGTPSSEYSVSESETDLQEAIKWNEGTGVTPVGESVWCSTYKRVTKSLETALHCAWFEGTITEKKGEKFFLPKPKEKPIKPFQARYYIVVNPGPLIMIHVPEKSPRWRDLVKALTPVMQSHDLRQKDISMIEAQGPAADSEKAMEDWRKYETRLNQMYAGDTTILPEFNLYDWQNGEFVLVRKAVDVSSV